MKDSLFVAEIVAGKCYIAVICLHNAEGFNLLALERMLKYYISVMYPA